MKYVEWKRNSQLSYELLTVTPKQYKAGVVLSLLLVGVLAIEEELDMHMPCEEAVEHLKSELQCIRKYALKHQISWVSLMDVGDLRHRWKIVMN